MNTTTEQTREEVELKMKMAKTAFESGEMDHLHPDQSFSARYTRQLHRIAGNVLKESVKPDTEEARLQSILGMVHTLVLEGRTEELYKVIAEAFPEYYSNSQPA